ncbi:MAG: hypothetical protein WC399_02130 [Bacilli bacterium]|jgi:hypothetical protein
MNKISTIALSTILAVLAVTAVGRMPKSKPDFDIVYLDEPVSTRLQGPKYAGDSENGLYFDSGRDAYVLNKASFRNIVPESAQRYLEEGGVILVNDNEVTHADIVEKIDTNVVPFDYRGVKNQYGFYIVNDGRHNMVTNVSLGYLTPETTISETTADLTMEIAKTTIVNSVVSTAVVKTAGYNFEHEDDNVGPGIETGTSGQKIAEANLENVLYSNEDGSYICTYTIKTEIYDVAKVVKTGTVTPRGVYDVLSTFETFSNPAWAVEKYKMRMLNTNTIVDAAHLETNEDTTVTLSGSLGFSYSIMAGALVNGPTYVNEDQAQYYNLDFSSNYYKYWEAAIPRPILGREYYSIPSVRIVNSNDFLNTTELSRMETFQVIDNGFWLIIKRMYMDPAYRKELKIVWNSFGLVSQMIITG